MCAVWLVTVHEIFVIFVINIDDSIYGFAPKFLDGGGMERSNRIKPLLFLLYMASKIAYPMEPARC